MQASTLKIYILTITIFLTTFLTSLSASFESPIPIDINSSHDGIWENDNSGSHHRANSYSEYYTFTLDKATFVNLHLYSDSDEKAYVYFFDANATQIGEKKEGFEVSYSKYLETGTYTIEINVVNGFFYTTLSEFIINSEHIELNTDVNGEWTTLSKRSINNGNYSQYYTFTLEEDKEIFLDIDTYQAYKMYIMDSNYTVVDIFSLGSVLPNGKQVIQLSAGSYLIDMTTMYENNNETGNYTFKLVENNVSMEEIFLDSLVNGELNNSVGISPRSGNKANYYTFTLDEPKDVVISLDGTMDTVFYLLDTNGTIIESRFEYPDTENVAIVLDAGTYTIDVTSMYANDASYALQLRENNVSTIPIDLNSTASGDWNQNSGISPRSETYANYYTFTLDEPKDVVIKLDSNAYANLYILDSNNSIIAEKSGFNDTTIMYKLDKGTYTIDASSRYNNIGTFELTLRENTIAATEIVLNSITDGEWYGNSGISPRSKHYTHYYTFTLAQKTDIVIDFSASTYHKKIYLLDSNGTILEETYGDETVTLKTLNAGTYTIDATTDYRNIIGSFTLRLKENIITSTPIELNSTKSGEWRISSGISPRSKKYANYYTFLLLDETDIIINIDTASNENKEVYLLDVNGTIVKSLNGYNKHRMVAKLQAGTYTIDLSSKDLGNYTLGLYENIVSQTDIAINSTINGEWSPSSGFSSYSKNHTNYYIFTLEKSMEILIDLETDVYNSLYLLDANGSLIKSSSSSMVTSLSAGTYIIDVSFSESFMDETSGGGIGSYILHLKENLISNTKIEFDDTIDDALTNNSGKSTDNNRYINTYTFTLDKRTNIICDVNSSELELEVRIRDSNNNSVAYGESENHLSRIVKTLNAGTYTIEVTTPSWEKEEGNYTLQLRENIILDKDIIFNTPVSGEISISSGLYDANTYNDYYTFTLTKEQKVSLILKSDTQKSIYISKNNSDTDFPHWFIEDDSSNQDKDANITRVLSAGTYKIKVEVNTYYEELGFYELEVLSDVSIPNQVSMLNTIKVKPYSATITWAANENNIVGYKIYQNGKLIANVAASVSSYTMDALGQDSHYTYSVVAYNSAGESEAVSGEFRTKKDDYAWLIPVYHGILY